MVRVYLRCMYSVRIYVCVRVYVRGKANRYNKGNTYT